MRVLMTAKFPNEPFNSMVREGKVEEIMNEIMREQRAEAVYFTELDGQRGCIIVTEINNQSQIPAFAEPYFLNFNAECHFSVAMTPEDLRNANLDEIGKKWEASRYHRVEA